MSETRQLWNPCRAKTRIAASRICRRRSTGGALAMCHRLHGAWPAILLRASVRERGKRRAHAGLRIEIEIGDDDRLTVGSDRYRGAPRIDDHGAPVGVVVRRRGAVLSRGDHEGLILDRPG